MRKDLFKYSLLAIIVGLPSAAFGYGEGEDIPHGARVIQLLTNESRANVPDALAGCGSNCPEGISCFNEILPPLWWDDALYRMAQFHTVLEANLECKCQHFSPCVLSPTIGADYPDVCDGSPSCACSDGATTCNSMGTDPSTRGSYFTSYFRGENVAWAGSSSSAHPTGPYDIFYSWLHEKGTSAECKSDSYNGHRFNILSTSFATIGVGYVLKYYGSWHNLLATQDFGNRASEKPALTAGSHYLDKNSKLHFDTHYYSTSTAASKVMLSINGECKELSLTHGTNLNGAYGTTSIAEPAKCTPYFFEVKDANGTITRYPTAGSLLFTIDTNGKQCDKTWKISDASSCFTATPDCSSSQHLNEAGDGCEDDSIYNCGVHGNDCTKQSGWAGGSCVNGSCAVSACSSGFHIYNSNCEADSLQSCGSHGHRCDSMTGWSSGECQNGACVATSCKSGYHVYNHDCEDDSIQNCGAHGNDCSNVIQFWANGSCENGSCVVSECSEDKIISNNKCIDKPTPEDPICTGNRHSYNHDCEDDSIQNCGAHGNDCSSSIPFWADGSCSNGLCFVSACSNDKIVSENACVDPAVPEDPICSDGKHLYNHECEDDSIQNCGAHGNDCSASIPFWADGSCSNGLCSVTSCSNDKIVSNSQCIDKDPGTPADGCNIGYHEYDSSCELDSVENCGSHGNTCAATIQYWAGGNCINGTCAVSSCTDDKIVSNNKCIDKSTPSTPANPDKPSDPTSTDSSINININTSPDDGCSGMPMSSSNGHLPVFIVLGIAGLGLLRRRREH